MNIVLNAFAGIFLFILTSGAVSDDIPWSNHSFQDNRRTSLDRNFRKSEFLTKESVFDKKKKFVLENQQNERRRSGFKAKFSRSGSRELRLHHQESLEYYLRARQIKPIVQNYLDCLAKNSALYENTGRVTSEATVKLVGQEITLKCRDCHYPGRSMDHVSKEKIEWRLIPYSEPRDILMTFDSEKFVFDEQMLDLTIKDLVEFDSGRYRCVINKETVRVYDIQIVENDKSNTVFENSLDGPTAAPPVILPERNLQFYSNWDEWAECNECGKPSIRRRVGICMVQKITYSEPIKPIDYPAFNMYGWGLPCRSPLLPANFSQEMRVQLSRPSEIQIGHCLHPCPTPPPIVFITDENGKIVDQYKELAGTKYSLDSSPPKLPPLVQRSTVYEEEGDRIRMYCPKASGKSVRWQNCSTTEKGLHCRTIDPFHAEKMSKGRIVVTLLNALLVKNISFSDAGIYSCFYDGRLIATTKLFVNPKRNRNVKKILAIAGIVILGIFFLVVVVFIIKNA